VIADDIDHNWGFALFTRTASDGVAVNCVADDGERLFGIERKQMSSAAQGERL
jgi:hypothetical protein